MNDWVEQQTNNKITDLIPANSLDQRPPCGLVLTNAIYFKDEWARECKASRTVKRTFHLTTSKSEMIDMMHIEDEKLFFGASEKWDCKIFQLPYKGKRISMMIILPNQIDGLKKDEANFSLGMLTEIRSQISRNHGIAEIQDRQQL